jgi:hypothetical protein
LEKIITTDDIGLTMPIDPEVEFDARESARWELRWSLAQMLLMLLWISIALALMIYAKPLPLIHSIQFFLAASMFLGAAAGQMFQRPWSGAVLGGVIFLALLSALPVRWLAWLL